MKHIVLGAGPLGAVLSGLLAAQGEDVRLYGVMNNSAYDMPGTQPLAIDGDDPEQVRRVCAGADVIFLCLNAHYVEWYDLYPPRLNAALAAAATTGAKLIYHDNVYMYGRGDSPYTEDMPTTSQTRKGVLREDMAGRVLAAHQAGKIRAGIGRSADMYGPGALNSSFNSTLGQRHFYPALAGQTVRILGDIDAPHTYAYVDDVAQGLITLAEDDDALGEVWHVPAASTLSHRQLMTLVFAEAGHAPKVRGSRISGMFVRGIGLFQPDVREVAETLYQFEKPFVVDHQKFERAFGATPTPHTEAIQKTLHWYRANPLPGP